MTQARRIGGFAGLARLLGLGGAARTASGWGEALAGRPELVRDLAMLGFLEEDDVRLRGGRPAPLPADEMAMRAGARMVARAILDRAGLTTDDVRLAMKELDDDADDGMGLARPLHARG